jgi:MFS family permease
MSKNRTQRISLSIFFFLSGFCFATWASRIPTIKTFHNLNDAELGNLLLILPISSLAGLPLSGWLVSRFNSRIPLVISLILLALSLGLIGFSSSLYTLATALFLFSFNMRILNISMNTQSITIQKSFIKKIVGAFHGLWSTGGVFGVLFSTLMVKMNTSINLHFLIVTIFSILTATIAFPFLLKNDKAPSGNTISLKKPDKQIMLLGIIIFCAALYEGGMFDWSGVYFKEVVAEDLFTLGYLVFLCFMALSRFFSDKLMEYIGMEKLYIISALTVSFGIIMVIMFPYFWPSIIGFSIVGIGVAVIFPMTFFLAGKSKKYSVGITISIITTYAIAGMLLGPPLIGYIAHALNLKIAFVLFIISALLFIPISKLYFKSEKQQQSH